MVCTKVKGEPIYEIVKPVPIHQEIIVYFLPERPEELFFSRMRNTIYRQTMDSILEGESGGSFYCFLYLVLRPVYMRSNCRGNVAFEFMQNV